MVEISFSRLAFLGTLPPSSSMMEMSCFLLKWSRGPSSPVVSLWDFLGLRLFLLADFSRDPDSPISSMMVMLA